MARAICYGQRGEIRKRYREGQEDQLGALGLVTNTVVLWNLSPLIHGHINMLGHYTFSLPEDILKGELRQLNTNTNNELIS